MNRVETSKRKTTPTTTPTKPEAPPPKKSPPKKPKPAAPAPPSPSKQTKPFNRAKDRVDAIEATRSIKIDGIKLRYAYLSQRGFYPDDPFKANQDSYSIQETLYETAPDDLSSSVSTALFGVYDGHGQTGDLCSQFAKKHMPSHLKSILSKKKGELTDDQIHSAVTKAHVNTNKALKKDKNIDDSLSGTTAISVFFHGQGNRITVANVGDSRAIIGHQEANGIKAFPLSRDQTPYRKDERARIKATGARVLSLDQMEGLEPIHDDSESNHAEMELGEDLDEDGDPPRVWAPDGDYPGTAFTRSIGDSLAEDLGVYAEPELLSREILPSDKMLIIASDGVYEFLTNQSVIDICAKFKDPLEACRAVVNEAYELWLQYELRTDDITIIALFIDDVVGKEEEDKLGKLPEMDNTFADMEGFRPVRKTVSKEKSKEIEKLKALGRSMRNNTNHVEETIDLKKLRTKKTPEEKASIAEAIKASVMFRNVTDQQKDMIFECMESVHVKAGTWVIRQGTVGDRFYIIDEGQFQVRILPDGMEDETGEGGNIVHQYEGSRAKNTHPSFGELALMYSAPRSASIIALTDGHLWALHRAAFRQVLVEAKDDRKELKAALSDNPYFQYLDSDGFNKLASLFSEASFGRGENIVEQGRPGQYLYVIKSGTCYSVQMGQGETKRGQLKAGHSFGDELMSGNGRYNMTVMSLQTTNCWQLDIDVLKQTMGPLLQGGA